MNRMGFVLRNVGRSGFRSWIVALSAGLLAGMSFIGFVISHGSEASLRTARDRVGADLLVIPADAAQRVETALLMGVPTRAFMPEEVLNRIATLPGVLKVSPQLYLSTLPNASCCSVGEMFGKRPKMPICKVKGVSGRLCRRGGATWPSA
jgi:putative ABC transport system permease protein